MWDKRIPSHSDVSRNNDFMTALMTSTCFVKNVSVVRRWFSKLSSDHPPRDFKGLNFWCSDIKTLVCGLLTSYNAFISHSNLFWCSIKKYDYANYITTNCIDHAAGQNFHLSLFSTSYEFEAFLDSTNELVWLLLSILLWNMQWCGVYYMRSSFSPSIIERHFRH